MSNLFYGIIGNCHSCALISHQGSLDWCCLPEFDSSSVFAKILDKKKGGSFEIIVDKEYIISQEYFKQTNILVTTFEKNIDRFEILDFMPRYKNTNNSCYKPPDIIRYIKHKSGTPKFKVKYDSQLEYAAYPTNTEIHQEYIKSTTTKGTYNSIYLYSDLNKKAIIEGEIISLRDDRFFLLSYNEKIMEQTIEKAYIKLQRTKVYWLNWVSKIKKFMKYNEQITRSALVLKLLNYEKSGAILAAATTSLPEALGESRNWDYRFCWIRDASMVIKVMVKLGNQDIAQKYLNFIMNIIGDKDEKLQIMYGINGEKNLTEKTLDYLHGYEGSKPVRIGNAAYKQKQNDIYGILMDVILQQFQQFHTSLEHSENLWTIVREIVKKVTENWVKPDKGIWELRVEDKHFTFSKVLCWVAIDRARKIAKIIQKNKYANKLLPILDSIKKDILKNAWNEKRQTFTQYYGSDDLDASVLLMESYGFINAKDPQYVSTVLAIQKDLCKDGLMYRYKNKDDFGLPTSSFTICSFWLINSLNKIGKKQEAQQMFDQLLKYSNHLWLFSEDIDFKTKRLLGNFPQAYSHLALIETATNLSNTNKTHESKILDAIH